MSAINPRIYVLPETCIYKGTDSLTQDAATWIECRVDLYYKLTRHYQWFHLTCTCKESAISNLSIIRMLCMKCNGVCQLNPS